jgi:hypothetical protein
MAITAAEFQLFLEPKLSNIWHDAFPAKESVFSRVMNVRPMNKNTITDAKMAGFGSLQGQNDGQEVTFDDPIAPQTVTYTYIVRALGYRVHDRIRRYDLYGEIDRLERDLMDSARDDAETSAASLFNNAFGTTNTGFDSLQLCSTAHTRLDGGTNQLNRPSTDEALSLSALHNGIIQMKKWLNDRGRPRQHMAKRLIIPPDLAITAAELLQSILKPGTANNDDNVIQDWNLETVEWNYLTSTTAWFLQADRHDLNWFWAFRPETGMEEDFKTEDILRKVRQGYAYGFGEWRGIYGTDGVA